MRLNLTKPLVVFDLEATGLDLVNDRIIQISYVKVSPGDKEGEEERKSIFVNPGKPIPAFVQQLTGITDDMVKDAPTFKQEPTSAIVSPRRRTAFTGAIISEQWQ